MAQGKQEKQELKQSVLKTEVEHPEGGVSQTQEVLEETVYTQPTCNIGLALGFTQNVGNYSNVKATVSLFAPCYPNEVDDVFDGIKEKVEEKLALLMAEVKTAYGIA